MERVNGDEFRLFFSLLYLSRLLGYCFFSSSVRIPVDMSGISDMCECFIYPLKLERYFQVASVCACYQFVFVTSLGLSPGADILHITMSIWHFPRALTPIFNLF